jgi:hypothetical protein
MHGISAWCANFEGADLTRVKAESSLLGGAKLKGATLKGVLLKNSRLVQAEFGDEEVRGVDLQDVFIWPLAEGSTLSLGPEISFIGTPVDTRRACSPFGTGRAFILRV